MVEGDLGRRVVAVGLSDDAWVAAALRLASEYGLEAVRCSDIYDTVAELAGAPRCTLVVGPLQELAREDGHFFCVAARNGARCCTLLDQGGAVQRRDVLAAVQAGAWAITTLSELAGVFDTWLTTPVCPPRASRPAPEEFLASPAELDALLGLEADG